MAQVTKPNAQKVHSKLSASAEKLGPGLGISPEHNLSRYLQEIRKFPMLSMQDEQSLATKWAEEGDEKSAHQLVNSHLRLVAKIAMGNRGYGLPIADLIAEGNIGLMQAVQRFDATKGFRFSTYAMWWIRASVHEYILHSWSLVKMGTTAAQKKLFFNLRRIKSQMKAYDDGDLTPEQVEHVSTQLGVASHEVVNMNRRLSGVDASLNAPMSMDGEGEWQDGLEDECDNQEDILSDYQVLIERRQLLAGAMKGLSEREQLVLTERRLKEDPATLEDLSQSFGISRERVRQIEVGAFEKLQKSVRNAALMQKLAN